MSIMVVTVTKTLVLEHEEEKALALYKRLELSEELRESAGRMLFYALKYKKCLTDLDDQNDRFRV